MFHSHQIAPVAQVPGLVVLSVGSPDMVDGFLGGFVMLSCERTLSRALAAESMAGPGLESLCFLQPGCPGNLPPGFLFSCH